jgi:hypothetical protein
MIHGVKRDHEVAVATSADLAEAGGRGPPWLEYFVLGLVLAVVFIVGYTLAQLVTRLRRSLLAKDVGVQVNTTFARSNVVLEDLTLDAIKRRLASYGRNAVGNKGELMQRLIADELWWP